MLGSTACGDIAHRVRENSFHSEIFLAIFYERKRLGLDMPTRVEWFEKRDVKDVLYPTSRGQCHTIGDWCDAFKHRERTEPFGHKLGGARNFKS